jgi:hypothetical protein
MECSVPSLVWVPRVDRTCSEGLGSIGVDSRAQHTGTTCTPEPCSFPRARNAALAVPQYIVPQWLCDGAATVDDDEPPMAVTAVMTCLFHSRAEMLTESRAAGDLHLESLDLEL